MTPERAMYHNLLTEFAASLPDGALVYDIGRTKAFEYRDWFPRQQYKSIDRNPKAEPDILMDVEEEYWTGEEAAGVLCNGVLESATNPFDLIAQSRNLLLANGGRVLFGIRLTAYPLSENHDHFRFTLEGARRTLDYYYNIFRTEVVNRDGIPSYGFFECGF